MAFFGLTHLGSQNPIGDKMIVNFQRQSHGQGGFTDTRANQAPLGRGPLTPDGSAQTKDQLPYSDSIHHGSHQKYKEMVKRIKVPRSPNQLYVMPMTDSQQYGWLLTGSPEPWTRIQHFPRRNSEMTQFVHVIATTDPDFSLF